MLLKQIPHILKVKIEIITSTTKKEKETKETKVISIKKNST